MPFPALTQNERLHALPPLQIGPDCCLTAEQVAQRAQWQFSQARLGMYGQTTVWCLPGQAQGSSATPHWHTFDATTGAALAQLTSTQAAAVAEGFSQRRTLHTKVLERDQWTVPQGLNRSVIPIQIYPNRINLSQRICC